MSKKIIIVGSGNSGSGAVFDYLAGKDKNLPLLNGEEFRITHDNDALNDLYINNYINFTINNSASSFERFEKYFQNFFKNHKMKRDLIKELKMFLNKIIFLRYSGLPAFKRNKFSINEKVNFYFDRLILKKKINDLDLFKMTLPVKKNEFLKSSSNFINNLIKILHPDFRKYENIIINQGASFWNLNHTKRFYDNSKIILVNRDPRSIFWSMKRTQAFSYPSNDVNVFIKWFKKIQELKDKTYKKNKNILDIKYEKFLENFDIEKERINKFINQNNSKKSNFDLNKSKQNLYKAKDNLKKDELKKIEKNLKNYLQW